MRGTLSFRLSVLFFVLLPLFAGCAAGTKQTGMLYKEKGTGQIYVLFTGDGGVKIPFPEGKWSWQRRSSYQIRLIERKSGSIWRMFEASALNKGVISKTLGKNVRDTVREFLDFEVQHHLRSDLGFRLAEYTHDSVATFANVKNREQTLGLYAWKANGIVYLISGLYADTSASPKDSLFTIHRAINYLTKAQALALIDTLKTYNKR